MKNLILSIFFVGFFNSVFAQNIQKVEYFFDTDPGIGNGIDVPITSGNTVTTNLTIPLSTNLTNGFHKFFIRAKNANGVWSMAYSQNFFKTNTLVTENSNISQLEYFIDSDPGYGLGNAIGITAAQNISQSLIVPIAENLPTGFHKFYIRAKSASGHWSVVYSQNFYKTPQNSNTLPSITKLEYFFNADPGYGLGSQIPITANTLLDLDSQLFTIDNSLSNGNHQFTLRAQDSEGKWSIIANQTITVCELGASISASPSLSTCGSAVTLTANIQNNSGDPITWTWMKDGRFIGQDNQNSISATESGRYSIQISNGNSGVCNVVTSGFADVHIKKTDSLNIKSDALASFCGSSVNLEIDNQNSALSSDFGFSYQWFKDGNIVSSTEQLNTTEGGNYQLKLNYLGGYASCSLLESNVLTIDNKKPLLRISPVSENPDKIEVCRGSSIKLNAICDLTGAHSYQWFKNNVLINGQNSPSLTVSNAPGDYQVKLSSGCAGLSSAVYIVSYKVATQPSFNISLTEGSLLSCPGTMAKLMANSCSGNVTWSNGMTGTELTVSQQNISQTFSAHCQTTCFSSSTNEITFSPSAPTLLPPIIEVERLPATPTYKFAKSSKFYRQPQFKYADYQPPVGIVPTANGQIFYTDAFFDFHLLEDDQTSVFLKNESIAATAVDMILLKSDLFLTTGFSAAGIGELKSQASFGGDDFWILSRDHLGNKIWDKTYGGTAAEKAIKAIQLPNSDIIIAGESSSAANGNKTSQSFGGSDIWIVKTDADGQKISDFSYGGNGTENLGDAITLSNSNILLIGSSNSGISGNKTSAALGQKDIWLVCINTGGVIIWQKAIGTDQNEEGVSAVEKEGFIYLISTDHKIRKLDLNGNIQSEAFYDFDDYFESTSHSTDLHGIYLTPDTSILVTSRVYGQSGQNSSKFNHSYDALYIFEIDNNLSIKPETKESFGSTTFDHLGKCFFDQQGDFHLIKRNAVFTCPNSSDPLWYAYYMDNSANYSIHCNRPSDNFYGWFQWVISPHRFEERNYIDQCRGTEFLLRARTTNEDFEGQVNFQWSTGDTTAILKINPENRIPVSLSYKPKNLQNFCGSPVSHIDLFPYENILLISGLNIDDASLKFAHQEVFSAEKLQVAKKYQSEGGIFLEPGFEITASNSKVFKAEIVGCSN